MFWLIIKWENRADQPHSDRYLILIAYIIGVSIAVHLLNLLCIPAIVLVIYYRKFKETTATGSLIALAIAGAIVALILFGLVPGFIEVAQYFELFFVNTLGMGYNIGVLVYTVLFIAVMIWSVRSLYKQKSANAIRWSFLAAILLSGIPFIGSSLWIPVVLLSALAIWLWGAKKLPVRILTVASLSVLVIFVGYSSYALLLIRSHANPPMNQNAPDNVFSLGSYLSREQYGETPLLYGHTFKSSVMYQLQPDGYNYDILRQPGKTIYHKGVKTSPDQPDNYVAKQEEFKYEMTPKMLFPRMYSERHKRNYEEWMGGIKGKNITIDHVGERKTIKVPTMMENLYFFWSYQVNFMYWRYFMWNFAGRQNDIQGHGELEHGNWITGISFFDNMRLGDQSKLPSELRENKGRNVFYCLPLILGILGLVWQVNKRISTKNGMVDEGVKQFWVVFFLFFMTGLAIVLYLNQTPVQPRERDYAYAGSFYAFAIWIGLGVAAISDLLNKYVFKKKEVYGAVLSGLCLLVPVQMASQTWDDHDRSGRYTCRDFGQNYLMSLDEGKSPIIFTNGDNDTFPLWYCQETEGFRTDARVCNLSYLQTDWYIDQMKRPAYDSPAVPISWKRLQYVTGTREGISVRPGELERAIEILKDDPETMKELLGENPYELSNIIDRWILNENEELQCFPTDSVVITIDKEAVRRSGMLIAGDSIPDVMHISLKGKRAVYKSEMMIYEMLCRTNWERPLYVACTVGSDNYGSLGNNFVREGLADRITPFNTKKSGKTMDTERMYDNIMNKFRFGGLDNPDIYLDETVLRMCYTHRRLMSSLAMQLMRENKADKALNVVRYAEEVIPAQTVSHNYMSGSLDLARVWLMQGYKKEAEDIVLGIATNADEYLQWYAGLSKKVQGSCAQDILYNVYQLNASIEILKDAESDKYQDMEKALQVYHVMFQEYLYR